MAKKRRSATPRFHGLESRGGFFSGRNFATRLHLERLHDCWRGPCGRGSNIGDPEQMPALERLFQAGYDLKDLTVGNEQLLEPSVSDLARAGRVLYGPRVLPQPLSDLSQTPHHFYRPYRRF